MAEPLASVVVPARDAARQLPPLLGALDDQTVPRTAFEVIVVDNGSSDATASAARAGGATVLFEPQPNRCNARNAGAAQAAGPVLAFIDADCVPVAGWLEELLAGAADTPLVAGPIDPVTSPAPNRVERFERMWRFRQESYVLDSGWAPTGNLAVRTLVFRSIGGFDPVFWRGGEDVDLCLRARAMGHEIGWRAGARVSHPAERTMPGLLRRGVRHGYAATHHARHTRGAYGRRYWRHPAPLLGGDWPLRRFGIDLAKLDTEEAKEMLRVGRLEYGARVIGSLAAELSRPG